MKILIFEEVRTCSTKKLWDRSRVQGKDQEEKGWSCWMHKWDRNWKTTSAIQHPRLDTCWGPSPCLVPLDITLESHELQSWPNSEAENGNDLVSWTEVIWSVSLMTWTSMEPLKFSRGKSRNNQKSKWLKSLQDKQASKWRKPSLQCENSQLEIEIQQVKLQITLRTCHATSGTMIWAGNTPPGNKEETSQHVWKHELHISDSQPLQEDGGRYVQRTGEKHFLL